MVTIRMKILELTLGCDLSQASARHWNSHDEYPQFGGPSFIIKQGLGALLMKMAAGLNIEYKKQVIFSLPSIIKSYCLPILNCLTVTNTVSFYMHTVCISGISSADTGNGAWSLNFGGLSIHEH